MKKQESFFEIKGVKIVVNIVVAIFCVALVSLLLIPNPMKKKNNERNIYRNEKCVLVGTNEAAQDFTHDKFHKPIVIKVWLIQRVSDTTQFAEISSYNDNTKAFHVTKELWYTKDIGDTLYFDYILKKRFFTIKK